MVKEIRIIKIFIKITFLFLKKKKDKGIFFPSVMNKANLLRKHYNIFDPNLQKNQKNLNLTHNLTKIWGRKKGEKSSYLIQPHQLTIFYFPFFSGMSVCKNAKWNWPNFPPIYLKVMWFYAINPIPVAHFLDKTCNNTHWDQINSEGAFLSSCTCNFTRYFNHDFTLL